MYTCASMYKTCVVLNLVGCGDHLSVQSILFYLYVYTKEMRNVYILIDWNTFLNDHVIYLYFFYMRCCVLG